MRLNQAKKLRQGDQIRVKETNDVEMVYFTQDEGEDIIIFTYEGSDYTHTQVK
jgi:superfamily II helicase